jgi:hypothetical protein
MTDRVYPYEMKDRDDEYPEFVQIEKVSSADHHKLLDFGSPCPCVVFGGVIL